MAQQDSPIPMADDRDDNKKSNAIELDNDGFDALYIEIKKQDARELKNILKGVELENPNTDKDNG